MEVLREWAMTVAGIVVFGSACEMILPDGNFRKYVRLAIGLVLIMTLVSPLQGLLKNEIDFDIEEKSLDAYTRKNDMEERQQTDVLRLYRQNLNEKIQTSLTERLGNIPMEVRCSVEENDPETFGVIREVAVMVDAAYGKDITQGIGEILSKDFGVEEKKLTVHYLKESNE
ncbi:MAG: stage III sporulation protein AF [Clostridia bacterium]|nr:stage III sporulation protein AF [Clostridia bacterium]